MIEPNDSQLTTRRQFITGAVVGLWGVGNLLADQPASSKPATGQRKARVVIAQDKQLINQAGKLFDAAIVKLTGSGSARDGWLKIFSPKDIVGIKVNCLGHTVHPELVMAFADRLIAAGIKPGNIIIWDRFDSELQRTGFKLNRSGGAVKCYGTDSGGGYQRQIQSVGQVGTCYSNILVRQCTALVSFAVLKDHNLAGTSLCLKNFFGAIHNPNKYHERNCDPYIADVFSHRYIRKRFRLAVCDALMGQYDGGPPLRKQWQWQYNGVLLSTDPVALDAYGTELIAQQRKDHGLKSLAQAGRPTKYITTAQHRNFGIADLNRIEVVYV